MVLLFPSVGTLTVFADITESEIDVASQVEDNGEPYETQHSENDQESILLNEEEINDEIVDLEEIDERAIDVSLNRSIVDYWLPSSSYGSNWHASHYQRTGGYDTSWISVRMYEIMYHHHLYNALMKLGNQSLGYQIGSTIQSSYSLVDGDSNGFADFLTVSNRAGLGYQSHRGWTNVVSVPAISSGVGRQPFEGGHFTVSQNNTFITRDGVLKIDLYFNYLQITRLKAAPLTDSRLQLTNGRGLRVDYDHQRWGAAGARLNNDLSIENITELSPNFGALHAWDSSRIIQSPPIITLQATPIQKVAVGGQLPKIESFINVSNKMEGGTLQYSWISQPATTTAGRKQGRIKVVDTLGSFTNSSEINVNIDVGNFWGTSEWILHENGTLEIREGSFDASSLSNRPTWHPYHDKITKIEFTGDVNASASSSFLFAGLPLLQEINNLNRLNTSNVNTMRNMFADLPSLESLDLSTFDTKNVSDFGYMFSNSPLGKLDVDNFNTENATNLSGMFSGMHNLEYLDLSKFDTSKVASMNYLVWSCRSLVELNLSGSTFDTQSTSMIGMFSNTTNLGTLHLGRNFKFTNDTGLSELPVNMIWQAQRDNGAIIYFPSTAVFISSFVGSLHAGTYRITNNEPIHVKIPIDMIFSSNEKDHSVIESREYYIENLSKAKLDVSIYSIEGLANIKSITRLNMNELLLIEDGVSVVNESKLLMNLEATEANSVRLSGIAKEVEQIEYPSFYIKPKFNQP